MEKQIHSTKLKVFTDPSHYDPQQRWYLHSILKAQWNNRSVEERLQIYGKVAMLFEIVDDIANADIYLLPMNWNYYLKFNKVHLATEFAHKVAQHGHQVVVCSEGDFRVRFPFDNAIIFQTSLDRSQLLPDEYAMPPIIEDNVDLHLNGQPKFRPKREVATVGFCGHATTNPLSLAKAIFRNNLKYVAYSLGINPYIPPPIVPSAYLRHKVLSIFEKSSMIKSNFVARNGYWGGEPVTEEKKHTDIRKLEYIDNLNASDYILCVRGTGNWSKRFYETLSWGRIPVFIDTDCVLPYDFAIDWKQYMIWIDKSEIKDAPQKVADFHTRLSPHDFIELQRQCRSLWENYLSGDGFYENFHQHFTR